MKRYSAFAGRRLIRAEVICWLSACCLFSSCGSSSDNTATKASTSASCAGSLAQTGAGSSGSGYVFNIDPMISSGNASLSPSSTQLDNYRKTVSLERLGGRGVLEGTYVEVRNDLSCAQGFGASDSKNQFLYAHSDQRFQEVMSYYYGDDYRHKLDLASSLTPAQPVVILANCSERDNAYYSRQVDSSGQVIDYVCLGYSGYTTGAYYADDATVITHELQHATTVHSYSNLYDLNQFWFDEAGSMNEAISDFMALMYEVPSVSGGFDLKLFSRWALGKFMSTPAVRGSRRCPTYDSTSGSDCGAYSSAGGAPGAPIFSAASNRVSYSYPDGLGWPYQNSYTSVKDAFTNYSSQEEIHNASIIITGSLWEIYSAIKANHAGDHTTAYNLTVKLITQALATLQMPISSLDRSPVTFIKFGQALISRAAAMNYGAADQTSIQTVLTQRGLFNASQLGAGWASAGPGAAGTPGIRILDTPSTLKSWLTYMGFTSTGVVTQSGSTSTNGLADPGEVVAAWFDVLDSDALTAGGVLVDVVSPDADVSFMDANYNFGYISSSHAQVRYSKVNGTTIKAALNDGTALTNTTAGNSYFTTNKKFDSSWYTAFWLKISPAAAHSKTVNLQVTLTPSNGPASTVVFPLVIN